MRSRSVGQGSFEARPPAHKSEVADRQTDRPRYAIRVAPVIITFYRLAVIIIEKAWRQEEEEEGRGRRG